jgi:hypothetical protein
MTAKTATVPNNLASIIPVDMLQTELARRLMNMTISDLIKLAGTGTAPVAPTKRKKQPKAKKPIPVKKKAKRVRRKLPPVGERIAELLQGASESEWRTMSEIANNAGVEMPNGNMRIAMTQGWDGNPPVLEWNGISAAGARYRSAYKGQGANIA